ncbi:MAG TPA: hypothetical protein PLV80_08080, partial [Prolixibacteraceae bacterium]|nr:hypothetical protein [Prolixibacteraceae bacterium]
PYSRMHSPPPRLKLCIYHLLAVEYIRHLLAFRCIHHLLTVGCILRLPLSSNAFVIKTNRAERVLLLPGGELHCRFIWNEFK